MSSYPDVVAFSAP